VLRVDRHATDRVTNRRHRPRSRVHGSDALGPFGPIPLSGVAVRPYDPPSSVRRRCERAACAGPTPRGGRGLAQSGTGASRSRSRHGRAPPPTRVRDLPRPWVESGRAAWVARGAYLEPAGASLTWVRDELEGSPRP
jgi:hypothetical protein